MHHSSSPYQPGVQSTSHGTFDNIWQPGMSPPEAYPLSQPVAQTNDWQQGMPLSATYMPGPHVAQNNNWQSGMRHPETYPPAQPAMQNNNWQSCMRHPETYPPAQPAMQNNNWQSGMRHPETYPPAQPAMQNNNWQSGMPPPETYPPGKPVAQFSYDQVPAPLTDNHSIFFSRTKAAFLGWPRSKKITVCCIIAIAVLAVVIGGAVGGTLAHKADQMPNCAAIGEAYCSVSDDTCGGVGLCNFIYTPNTNIGGDNNKYGCCDIL